MAVTNEQREAALADALKQVNDVFGKDATPTGRIIARVIEWTGKAITWQQAEELVAIAAGAPNPIRSSGVIPMNSLRDEIARVIADTRFDQDVPCDQFDTTAADRILAIIDKHRPQLVTVPTVKGEDLPKP